MSFGATLTPSFAAISSYPAAADAAPGSLPPQFLSSFAFFFLYMGLLSFIYLVCALRTNIVFVGIFGCLLMTFCFLAGSYWQGAAGHMEASLRLQHVAGGFGFASTLLGWYLFLVQLLASVDWPVSLPVGDLSRVLRGKSERAKRE